MQFYIFRVNKDFPDGKKLDNGVQQQQVSLILWP